VKPVISTWICTLFLLSIAFTPPAHAQCANPKVLLTGGFPSANGTQALDSAELFDPGTQSFSPTAENMLYARAAHTATKLLNGKVLIVGGLIATGGAGLATAEVYDPASNTFHATGNMHDERLGQVATRLQGGNVLVAGGSSVGQMGVLPLSTVEIYVTRTGAFRATGSLLTPGAESATLLPNGKVLVTSGTAGELFNPATQAFAQTAVSMTAEHDNATLLTDGRVLVAGNGSLLGNPADLYDWATDSFSSTGDQPFVMLGTAATLLNNKRVLFSGGYAFRLESDRLVLYRPGAKSFALIGTPSGQSSLTVPRVQHTATKLPNGKVLIAGGWSQSCNPSCADGTITVFDTAELFDPVTGTSTLVAGKMGTPRYGQTATLVCSPAT
jgi:hypothetical protein